MHRVETILYDEESLSCPPLIKQKVFSPQNPSVLRVENVLLSHQLFVGLLVSIAKLLNF